MPDVTECGLVTAIGLKKCGSSQIRKAFAEKTWEARQFPETYKVHRYVTGLRNPAWRLVSCWNHLVRPRVEIPVRDYDEARAIARFGPHLPFTEWVEWVIRQDPDKLNAHMRPQTIELLDVLRGKEGLIWIGMLERMRDLAKNELTDWLRWSVAIPNNNRHANYGYWRDYYDGQLLSKVRRYFDADYRLWLALFSEGCAVFDVRYFTEQLTKKRLDKPEAF